MRQRRRHRWRRFLAAATTLGILMPLTAHLTATADPQAPPGIEQPPALTLPPEFDEFYRPPADVVAAAAPGQVLRAREIHPAMFGFAQLNADAWQLLYRTTNTFGQAISTVTTVLKPRGRRPEGGRKLLSYQIAEDSAAQYCAPSYVVQAGSIPFDYVNAFELFFPIATGLGQGWTVALPDYEGPNSSYGTSVLNAQTTLDGIRAVESFEPAQLSGPQTPAALWGYSGGTVPTSFAAEIKDTYAPELNIVGIAAGGIAAADYTTALQHNNNGTYTGLIMGVFAGLANEYPEFMQLLRDNLDLPTQLLLGSKLLLCHPIGSAFFPFYNYLAAFHGGNPLDNPIVQRIIAENSLGQHTPSVPVYLYHAQYDEILPNAGVDRLVDKYCHDGAPSVTYVRELLAEHISGAGAQIPGAFNWLRDRLNGQPAQPGCAISSPTSVLTDADFLPTALDLIPTAVRALFGQAIGADK
ncbi:lipase family protein [Nocardia arthritidis]|uniref:Lipase n=1 Tax=Nocardia arthritidis TaxID=228602 RepID=A0A6G9YAM3_9NOCA|nr:lipase family protein [Nocardia arthritidis]QIS10093.1 lipase [Nocardia arthritidis]